MRPFLMVLGLGGRHIASQSAIDLIAFVSNILKRQVR